MASGWAIAAAILASSMAFIDQSAVNVALPALQRAFGAELADLQWVIEGYVLFLSALLLPAGTLGDRFGQRSMLICGTAIFALASLACGLSGGPLTLTLARCAQGAGAAVMVPASLALLYERTAERGQGRAIGTWAAASAMTVAAGPLLGGIAVEQLSWRWVFYINPPLAAVAIAILLLRVPPAGAQALERRFDLAGAALAVLGLGGLVFGLLEGERRGFGQASVLGALLLGAAALAAFLAHERRTPAPMLPLALFRRPVFAGVNLATLLLYAGLQGLLFFIPLRFIQIHGYSALAAGAALLPFVGMIALLSRASGGVTERIGPTRPLLIGIAIAIVGFLLFLLPGPQSRYWTGFFLPALVLGAGMGLVVPSVTKAALDAAGVGRSGLASAVNNTASRTGGLAAVAVFGVLLGLLFRRSLQEALNALALPPDMREQILAQAGQLAAMPLPEALSPAQAARLSEALADAFVTGFRAVALLAAVLAAAAGLAVWGSFTRAAARHGAEQ